MAALRDWRLWRVVGRVALTTPDELVAAARGARLGRRLVAISGVALAGPGGPLLSTVNEQACVWHRHTVHHRRVRQRPDGRQRTSLRRRRVAEVASTEPFRLAGPIPAAGPRSAPGPGSASGSAMAAGSGPAPGAGLARAVELRPAGLHVDRPVRAGVRILPALVSQPFPDAAGLMGRDRYVHREWLIRSGTPVYVLAEASTTATGVVVRRPATGPHVLSTRSPAGLRRHHLATAVTGFGLAGIAVASGIAAFFVF
jgi:hypothetical protein